MENKIISYLKINGEEILNPEIDSILATIQKYSISDYDMIFFILDSKEEISIHGNSNWGFSISIKYLGKLQVSTSLNLSLKYVIKFLLSFINSKQNVIEPDLFKEVTEWPSKFYEPNTYSLTKRQYVLLFFVPFILFILWSIPFVVSTLLIALVIILFNLDNLIHFNKIANSQQFYFVALGVLVFISGVLDLIILALDN